MLTLAHGGSPGPWILFLPLVWAVAAGGVVTVVRRAVRRGRGVPWRGADAHPAADSPIAVLGRRFAAGEIDEDEYWRRLSVLDEQFGRAAGSGAR
ncbi:SHOCT domain-containing protein [Streptomyces sp. NPDC052040]|uniref:SHOCT domain-containing protein n=1 Tax=Streptomyces sp. NPDC052040 TaxID=3365682 RepID=UPI0037CF0575